ncbi:MAG TPA: hypothetical protein PK971_13135, partial [Saprospiraceae bacterium]|nr:hypothetical protein [Saprospiraceae bacterium]
MDKPALLAQPEFFTQRAHSGKIVCARMPVADGMAHLVAVDTERGAHYCTCPFRPRPCVHALALAALHARHGAGLFEEMSDLPDWVAALLRGQVPVLPPSASASPSGAPLAARHQRRLERLERAAAGLEDLERWLQDALRKGLATLVSEDPAALLHIATRMADASLPGLSRQLRLLGQLPTQRPDWAERLSEGLAACALAVRAFRRRHHLPDDALADLQAFIGISTRRDEVLA